MYKNKRIIAIIPARSGSKGLKDKNIKLLDNKPLLAHSIEVCKKSEFVDKVFLSTDSELYKEIGEEFGAEVKELRPSELASDNSQSNDYIFHAFSLYEKDNDFYDYFIILQPTSPLREVFHIDDAIKMIVDKELDSVVSVSKASHIPQLTNTLPSDFSMNSFFKQNDSKNNNRQAFDTYYTINGSMYLAKIEAYKNCKTFYTENSKAYIMDKKYNVDIDDEIDFVVAESMYEFNKGKK